MRRVAASASAVIESWVGEHAILTTFVPLTEGTASKSNPSFIFGGNCPFTSSQNVPISLRLRWEPAGGCCGSGALLTVARGGIS